jgi:hypothetical protein
MSYGILKFKLPEETEEFEAALKATHYKSSLWEMDMYFRNRLKHEELDPTVREALILARAYLHELTEGLSID